LKIKTASPALWLRPAKPASANTCDGNPGRSSLPRSGFGRQSWPPPTRIIGSTFDVPAGCFGREVPPRWDRAPSRVPSAGPVHGPHPSPRGSPGGRATVRRTRDRVLSATGREDRRSARLQGGDHVAQRERHESVSGARQGQEARRLRRGRHRGARRAGRAQLPRLAGARRQRDRPLGGRRRQEVHRQPARPGILEAPRPRHRSSHGPAERRSFTGPPTRAAPVKRRPVRPAASPPKGPRPMAISI
jgi:hypothetical protein